MTAPDTSCFAWFEPPAVAGTDRQALWQHAKWRLGEEITISFLDGSSALRHRVREIAQEWLQRTGANLHFTWREDTNQTAVRITFAGSGQRSAIGTTCRRREVGPTMQLGGLAGATDDLIRRKTLHEFGHVLGMVHEHQLADAPILWNRQAIYDDLEGVWSREMIDRNLLDPIARGEHNAVAFDPASIMLYPIPARWTLNNYTSDYNQDLSAGDLAFIRNEYG